GRMAVGVQRAKVVQPDDDRRKIVRTDAVFCADELRGASRRGQRLAGLAEREERARELGEALGLGVRVADLAVDVGVATEGGGRRRRIALGEGDLAAQQLEVV